MGLEAARWSHQRQVVASLDATQRTILWAAAFSCIDATGWLQERAAGLADLCALSSRSLERHLPALRKIEYLVPGDQGFRLSVFLRDRQIGGLPRQPARQFAEKEKESTKEKEKALGEGEYKFSLAYKSSKPEKFVTMHPRTRAILALYAATPGTRGNVSTNDHFEADLLRLRDYSLTGIHAALVIGVARHISSCRDQIAAGEKASPVNSLEYFRGVIEEFQKAPPPWGYVEWKAMQLATLEEQIAAFYRARQVAEIR